MQASYKPGDFFELEKSFTYNDVEIFSRLSGDVNPIHLDAELASKSIFGQPIVHGLLVSSLFSAIIANHLPGPGSIYLHQSLNFKSPVFHHKKVIARVEVLNIKQGKPIFELKTTCTDENGLLLIEGSAIVLNKNL
jgi:acyl dehydratase